MLDKIALILTIIGGINWGLIGIFQFDLVAWIFGGQSAIISRIIYTLVALAAVWCISLLFSTRVDENDLIRTGYCLSDFFMILRIISCFHRLF